jgi:Methyltransferase domain
MTDRTVDRAAHWDGRYRTIGTKSVSWYEAEPRLSLDLIELVGARPEDPVIDVGGGASSLTGALQAAGFRDLTVLDVSSEALEAARRGLARPEEVTWIRADLLTWSPQRRWSIWHDRAVFHFLTDPAERDAYRERLQQAVEPGGSVIITTFAEDGPTTCSGLPVHRYRPDQLFAELGTGFAELGQGRFDHMTPAGVTQPLSWVVARRTI